MSTDIRNDEHFTTTRSGGEGRGQAGWTTTPPPRRDTSTAPQHVKDTVPADVRTIEGWGVDLEHRAAYRRELPSDVKNVRGEVRDWQVPHEKVHLSIEHPNLTPAFGVSCPPKGLSGLMRDYAYKYGEATNRHWMTLILADRVDMVESFFADALAGHPDNFVREKAWHTFYTYAEPRKKRNMMLLGAAAVGAIVLGIAVSNAMSDDD